MQITFKKSTLTNVVTLVNEQATDIMSMYGKTNDDVIVMQEDLTVTDYKNVGVLDSNGDITVTVDEELLIKYVKIALSFHNAMAPAIMIAVSAFKMFSSKLDSFMESFLELKEVAAKKKTEPTSNNAETTVKIDQVDQTAACSKCGNVHKSSDMSTKHAYIYPLLCPSCLEIIDSEGN